MTPYFLQNTLYTTHLACEHVNANVAEVVIKFLCYTVRKVNMVCVYLFVGGRKKLIVGIRGEILAVLKSMARLP